MKIHRFRSPTPRPPAPPAPASPGRPRARGPGAMLRHGLWQGVTALATGGPALLGGLATVAGSFRAILAGLGVGGGSLWLIAQGPRVFPRFAPGDAYALMALLVFLMLLIGAEKYSMRSALLRQGASKKQAAYLEHFLDADA